MTYSDLDDFFNIKRRPIYDFSEAIIKNIERTYTYAHAKNTHGYSESNEYYDALSFFHTQLYKNPFKTFMELDGFQYKRTKGTLDRYGIPYTEKQERRARIYFEVTEKMNKQRSDVISQFITDEDLEGTGIVKLHDDGFQLTTQETIWLARRIKSLPINKRTKNIIYKDKLSSQLLNSKEQMKALTNSLENQISILIGGAGTGKSFVTSSIIDQLMENGLQVAILAPTHKAREALQSKLKRGEVTTVHKFVHQPVDCQAIVVDEAGMLSTPLLYSLLENYEDQQLIFVGDKNQLPPIEYGRPFEYMQERFKTVEIKKNHRSESADIISLGREVLGQPTNANMPIQNIEVVANANEAFKKGAEVVITHQNRFVNEVNEEQRLKFGQYAISDKFKVGEEIISKVNITGRYYNGQLFEIVAPNIIKNKRTGRELILKDAYELEGSFDYAYGLTIHKSQGSEWDIVAYQPSATDTQNLAYVAITRAKRKLIIIGELKSVYPPERKWRQLHESYRI